MRAIVGVALVCGLALGLIGAAIFGGNDREIFVAPPEATVEGLMRAIVAGRYSRAASHLSPRASAQLPEAALRNLANEIKANSKVLDVSGEQISLTADTAQAVAVIRTTSGERRVAFRLVCENGVWFIDELQFVVGLILDSRWMRIEGAKRLDRSTSSLITILC